MPVMQLEQIKGYIYVRAEYPIAVDRFRVAIKQARDYGLLGKNIFGTDFGFDVEVRSRCRCFCMWRRNSTFRINRRKTWSTKIKTTISCKTGLWGKPTLINNVETYANITKIILNGAEWYIKYWDRNLKRNKSICVRWKC